MLQHTVLGSGEASLHKVDVLRKHRGCLQGEVEHERLIERRVERFEGLNEAVESPCSRVKKSVTWHSHERTLFYKYRW